ncbi:hypothetical protein LEL_09541 [Akanthomyces lecanii RCEF 1005]|uniref:DUF7820 domain-containing protein n=1 Tax=Akanthomyces lecanii RCEF 1005 TaxID=1081108 RepID=A0A168C556_CORDF|nr:hypothetical protein LEL_09541 [Akanthomyces lecanii RCEF 1005]
MDNSRRASAGSRRQRSSSTSSTASAASTVSSMDEEDYDLIASAAIPDGFRPSGPVPNPTFRRPAPPSLGQLLPPPQAVNPSFSKWNHRPSSVAKAPRPHDSLAIRADGSNATNASQTGGNGVPPLPVEAPYRGPSNPAHQYGMYPQRTASNATDRSVRGNRPSSYTGPRGPTHPYTLYTQGTAAAPVEATQQAIPVGFTGLAAPYERQIGPDGEDIGDLLGPLGHTEELPPYSRYPEVAFTTKPGPRASVVVGTVPTPAQQADNDEASGSEPAASVAAVPETQSTADVTPENPFASAEDDLVRTNSLHSRHSIRTVSTYRDDPSSTESFSEKEPRIQTKWQRRARKKLWGVIPYWSICLVFVGLIMGSVMGAIVGTLLTKGSKNKSAPDPPPPPPLPDKNPTPTVVDIQPLPTVPNALLPLPVGAFSLPQLDGGRASRMCLNDTSQLPAWSCNMPFRFYQLDLLLDVNRPSTERYNMTLRPINNTQSQLIWGTQPPFIKDPVKLRLVNDSFDKDGPGPAWWTSVSYEKTVIVRDSDLSPPRTQKRWLPGLQPATFNSKSKFDKQSYHAQPGDCMWICTWPQTVLEVLIYPGQNTSTSSTASTVTTSPVPTRTSSATGDSSYGNFDLDEMPNAPLSPYPKLVRMFERRTANSDPARCFKYQMDHRGKISPQFDPITTQPVEIVIVENTNTVHRSRPYDGKSYRDLSQDASGLVSRDSLEFTPCGCLWSQ